MREEYITIENGRIEKNGTPVFTDLNLRIYKRQIIGFIFDTIMERRNLQEFLKGNLWLSEGKIYVEENRSDALEAGKYLKNSVTFIEKESKLIENLHMEENVFLFTGKEMLIQRRRYLSELKKLIQFFGLELEVQKKVRDVTVKERVMIELLKAYAEQKKIIILTYMTGFLKKNELGDIKRLIKQMQNQGITFILVEQFENILFDWTDEVVIIRQGRTAAVFDSGTVNREQLYSSLLGQSKKRVAGMDRFDMEEDEEKEPVLKFENICTDVLKGINMEIEAGEVLKIYYMDDESILSMIALLKGEKKPLSGRIVLAGKEYSANHIIEAVNTGICFIEESPYDNMLFYNMSVRDNLAMALSRKVPFFWFRNRFVKSVGQLTESFNIEDIARTKLRRLEPHTLQKIAYYKWYLYAPRVVVCIKPFTETDIHLQEITVEMISRLKSRGISIIILTPNYSELYRVDGDIIYLKNGQMIDENEVYQTLYKK
jgi:ABC-type sugar transport system ATPase subunit